MAGNVGLNMVTDGLVFYNDYTNPKCYISGNTLSNDLTKNQYSGIVSGCTYSGNSLYFSGGSVVKIGQAINTGNEFTVSVWMRAPLLDNTRRAFVANSYNYTSYNGWLFSTAGNSVGNGCFFLSIGNNNAYYVSITGTISTNIWYYLSGVVQSGGTSIKLYKNNEIITASTLSLLPSTGGTITYTNQQFNIGYRDLFSFAASNDPYTGNIGLVQLYNRALSQEEITQNYNASKKRFNL